MVLGTVLSGILGLGSSLLGQYGVDKRQQIQREWQAEQDEINRQFQSREAQMARDWQEDFYNQYQSPEAMVAQYQAAGLNPALMMGKSVGGSVPPTTQTPQGGVTSATNMGAGAADIAGDIQSTVNMVNGIKQNVEQAKIIKNERLFSDIQAKLNKIHGEVYDDMYDYIKTTLTNNIRGDLEDSVIRGIQNESQHMDAAAEQAAKSILINVPYDELASLTPEQIESYQKQFMGPSDSLYQVDSAAVMRIIDDYRVAHNNAEQSNIDKFFAEERKNIYQSSGIDIDRSAESQRAAIEQQVDDFLNETDESGRTGLDYLIAYAYNPTISGANKPIKSFFGTSIGTLLLSQMRGKGGKKLIQAVEEALNKM